MTDDLFLPSQPEPLAVFSPCRRWRYELWRRWSPGPYCPFIGLNPSTADERILDPTVRRCIDYAKRWGYGALCMTNIFAWRDTDPQDMMKAEEPIGEKNDETLIRISKDAGVVIAAWGCHGSYRDRAKRVLEIIPNLCALKLNSDGSPAHPLYLRKSLVPTPIKDLRGVS